MVLSQLYGCTRDLSKKIPDTTVQSADGPTATVNAVYKRDALSTVSNIYNDFTSLLTSKRGFNESFRILEARFEAHVAKFNAHSDLSKLLDCLT